ncbi:MAG: four helix bundle protein [Bacteroidia bacterium]
MATVKRFEDLVAWQKARILNKELYSITADPVFSRDVELVRQMRRASISIASNIAEGFERKSSREMAQFLSIAKGSAGELRSQLYLAFDLNYLTEENREKLYVQVEDVSRLIAGLLNYLNNNNKQGYFKEEAAHYSLLTNITEEAHHSTFNI